MLSVKVFMSILYSRGSQAGMLAPLGGARQHLRECEMVIQFFVLLFCTVMLSLSCANCSAQSMSNYSARPSIQPQTMLISKKRPTHAISAETSKLAHILARDMLKYFRGAGHYKGWETLLYSIVIKSQV